MGTDVLTLSQNLAGGQIRIEINGGRGEIRTHGGREPTTVFKTVALNRSATLPSFSITISD